MKLTFTAPVWPGGTEYVLLPLTPNGNVAVTVPVSVSSPVLITENGSVLVEPMVTDPKSRLSGLTASCGGRSATIKFGCVFVLTPTGPLVINRTALVLAAE
jgi:hypothetical protein